MTDAREAARAAHASGGTVQEIADAMGETTEQVAEWLAVESHRRAIDPWEIMVELVRDAQDAMAAAKAANDSPAYKSLAATLGRLMPVLTKLEAARREDGVRILPAEIDAANERVRALVDAALRK